MTTGDCDKTAGSSRHTVKVIAKRVMTELMKYRRAVAHADINRDSFSPTDWYQSRWVVALCAWPLPGWPVECPSNRWQITYGRQLMDRISVFGCQNAHTFAMAYYINIPTYNSRISILYFFISPWKVTNSIIQGGAKNWHNFFVRLNFTKY